MKLTIIPDDSFVAVDGDGSHQPLDLSACNIPKDVHALQWFETKGWIEMKDSTDPFAPKPPNEIIDSLPIWAEYCVSRWQAWTPPAPPPTQSQPTTTGTQSV